MKKFVWLCLLAATSACAQTAVRFDSSATAAATNVRPTSLEEHLPYVPNFARHLVRTVLCEWCEHGYPNLSPEMVSALLGHYAEGEEPFGPHSSFNYSEFSDSMRLALGGLLKELGFRPIDVTGKEVLSPDPTTRRIRRS